MLLIESGHEILEKVALTVHKLVATSPVWCWAGSVAVLDLSPPDGQLLSVHRYV